MNLRAQLGTESNLGLRWDLRKGTDRLLRSPREDFDASQKHPASCFQHGAAHLSRLLHRLYDFSSSSVRLSVESIDQAEIRPRLDARRLRNLVTPIRR